MITHTALVRSRDGASPLHGSGAGARSRDPAVFAADPDRDTVFSLHLYGVYDTAAEVEEYPGSFVDRRLPIVVGEFGDAHSDGDPDEDAVMATARRLDLGYPGWSWSGNGGGVEYLDLATGFDAGGSGPPASPGPRPSPSAAPRASVSTSRAPGPCPPPSASAASPVPRADPRTAPAAPGETASRGRLPG
ncbi:cellulase family glycosylhydrolase, partial [Streptomyces sp. NPDC056503]|uniref:cellulase family glycosylhydrolase n=1 Tax=Streptomyces sp. NPDC056503 TaxID=3345842 RepID=UPI00368AA6D6